VSKMSAQQTPQHAAGSVSTPGADNSKITIQNLDLYYGAFQALKSINLNIPANEITAFIGPSGCGKSTLLKSLNRMNDLVEGCRITGSVKLDGADIYGNMDVNNLHRRVGMVFQKPNPFPMSVYDNIAFGPRTHGVHAKAKLDDIVERSLRNAAIWDELKDRLKKSALGLSGGQQQRLCIARALAVEPEVLLMDEPTSALDPISTGRIEDLAMELKKNYTIVIVTHNMQQAVRISDKTAFFLLGDMVEFGDTQRLFSMPQDKRTEDYITGRFG
jgi:phosphate transport system ATP-binding protein